MPSPTRAQDGKSEDGNDLAECVDMSTFEQILEMDDDDDRGFTRSLVLDFFEQALSTFKRMGEYLKAGDLKQLSALGHFLKGSSATLGLHKVKDSCEKIQNFGAKKDETGTRDVKDDDECLENCRKTIAVAEIEFNEAKEVLLRFYGIEDWVPETQRST